MAAPMKEYKLVRGKHRIVNPNFKEGVDDGETSHILLPLGSKVMLTDAQFKAFKDRFQPVSSASSEVRDLDLKELEDAKELAIKTGSTIDPNKSLAQQASQVVGKQQISA